ncbi:hypothetical protein J2R96_000101 [Bradyrhizobium elkanii]|nr:hypothetical protein [Bradyrhizobium elkanii]
MARKIRRLIGPDQRNIVAHLAQMPRSRRSDQAASDHRKFDRLIGAHEEVLRSACIGGVRSTMSFPMLRQQA